MSTKQEPFGLNEFNQFKETGRPITLPNNLTVEEFDWVVGYMNDQKKRLLREIDREKRLNGKTD